MAFEQILYEKADRVATITLNRPEVLNAYTEIMGKELYSALKDAEDDPGIGAVVLAGAGRSFCGGADIKGWNKQVEERNAAIPAELNRRLVTPASPRENMLYAMLNMTKPIIAAVHGHAVGIGATILLPCDIRVVADTAKIGFIFLRRGLTPELGSTYLLPRIIGLSKAKELCLTARIIDGQEAKDIGLAAQVFPQSELLTKAQEMARSIASGPPIAVAFTKRGLNMSMQSTLDEMVQYEHWAIGTCRNSEDFEESVRAFIEKREPKFRGR